MLKKYCTQCGILLSKKNKNGVLCNRHRDRTGPNNSFYGKKHKPETIEKSKVKLAAISKQLWQDPLYRDKVITGTSKPRRDGFKQEQSERIKKWYQDNPEQRTIRSIAISKSWKTGNRIPINRISSNSSQGERNLASILKSELGDSLVKTKEILRINDKWLFPDIVIDEILVVEYMGDFFHMNPKIYKATDVNAVSGLSAQEIWNRDDLRRGAIWGLGYELYTIWESEFKLNPDRCIDDIKTAYYHADWDSCI